MEAEEKTKTEETEKENGHKSGESHHHHSDKPVKHKTLAQRIVLKLLPLVLFFAGVACISYFAIQKGIINSSIMAVLISEASTNGGEGLDTSFDTVSIATSDGKLDIKKFPKIKWGDLWATISIPSQDVIDKPVYLGDKGNILDQMTVGTYFGSTYPGQNGKTVLCSHVGSTFYCIEDLKEGDRIILKTIYGDYEYEITDIVIFEPTDKFVVIQREEDYKEDRLFCYTCYPRDAAYRSKRIGVSCIRVSGIPWSEE